MTKQNNGKRKGNVLGNVKALLSVSALTATLVGWGVLAWDAGRDTQPDRPADIRAMLEGILGDLPQPVVAQNNNQTQGSGVVLRPVSLPAQSSSQPSPVTRTQSSR